MCHRSCTRSIVLECTSERLFEIGTSSCQVQNAHCAFVVHDVTNIFRISHSIFLTTESHAFGKSMKKSLLFLLALSLTSCIAEDDYNEECSVYLAESTVKNGGWGVFAGEDYEPGDVVGYAGLGVQVLESHMMREELLSKFLT